MKTKELLQDSNEQINIQKGISDLQNLVDTVQNKAISIYQELLGDDFEHIQNLTKKNKIISDFSINQIKEMGKNAIIMKINANKFREVDFANFCTIRVLTSTKENDEKEKLMRNIFEKIISKCKKIERKDSEYSLKKYSYEKDGVIISFGETFDFKGDLRDYNIHTYINISPTHNMNAKGHKKATKELAEVLK